MNKINYRLVLWYHDVSLHWLVRWICPRWSLLTQ